MGLANRTTSQGQVRRTISVIIPALNEEANVVATVNEVLTALGDRFEDYELLIFDDGSHDRTGELMDDLAKTNPRIRVTHNDRSRNLGGVYKQGIALARFDYLFLVPGDNEITGSALIRTDIFCRCRPRGALINDLVARGRLAEARPAGGRAATPSARCGR